MVLNFPSCLVLLCQISSPCYEPATMNMSVTNPFEDDGVFKVILLEMPEAPSEEELEAAKKQKKKQHKKGKKEEETPPPPDPGEFNAQWVETISNRRVQFVDKKIFLMSSGARE